MNDSKHQTTATYIGRFAPSPSGPLHLGSLVTALGSWLDAKAHQGKWLLRIEDIDPPRSVAGAASEQMATLDFFGLYWDGNISWQSDRYEAFEAALDSLDGHLFWCTCRRSQLRANGSKYAGTCYAQTHPPEGTAAAIRFRGEPALGFEDRQQGWCLVHEPSTDPILKRRDGLWAYALAVVVDDAAQGITDVVRGADLMSSTPVQIMLQQALQLPTPRYLHLPLITTDQGLKLSKQNHAQPLDVGQRTKLLRSAMQALGLFPPPEVAPTDLLKWAVQHWHQRVPTPMQQSLEFLQPKAMLQ
jgi:glutamyl-Q tRNA(Asp) synthetase